MSGNGSGSNAPAWYFDSGKSRLRHWYDLQAVYGQWGRVRAYREQRPGRAAEPRPAPLPTPRFAIDAEGDAEGKGGGGLRVAPFLISTTTGLFLWRDRCFTTLMPGSCFGLVVRGDTAFAFQQTGSHGRIVELRGLSGLNGEPAVTTRIWGLSPWVHQIDLLGDQLVVTDTDRNRLLFYDLARDGGPIHASASTRSRFLVCDARAGRDSPNYLHINSVVRQRDRLYVMAHNHSMRSGRLSEIHVLDESLSTVDVLPTNGRCCHNIIFADEAMHWFRSREGTLCRDGVDVLKTDGFTRGLAMDGDTVLVGVTRFAADLAGREKYAAAVEVYSADFAHRGRITFAAGQIREIRFLRGELGLSGTGEPEAGAFVN